MKNSLVIFLLFVGLASDAQVFKDKRRTFSYDTDDTTIMPDDVRGHKILFDWTNGKIYPEYTDSIKQIAIFLIRNPHIKVEISVHTDTRGSAKSNDIISRGRGYDIERYMESFKCPKNQYIVAGKGEQEPLISDEIINAENDEKIQEQYHRMNYRVEVKIISTDLK